MKWIITRALPEAEATAALLERLGLEPILAPMLTIRPLKVYPADLPEQFQALAFTSQAGVRHAPEALLLAGLPCYAVGDATAAALREAGAQEVHSADGDGAALAALLALECRPDAGPILHLGAAELAFDLAKALQAVGLECHHAPVYASDAATELSDEAVDALVEGAGVLFYSAKAAQTFADLAPPVPLGPALCISRACIAPIAHLPWALAAVAESPREQAMLAAVMNLSAEEG
jgi:uroporphyrinogen-III synthase